MVRTKYLIIGGGLTADAAVTGIREVDPEGAVTVVSAESDPPYTRPWLSKGLWLGKPVEKVWRGTEAKHADLRLGRSIVTLDPAARTAADDHGESYAYESLLMATGGRVRRLPFGGDSVIYYRTMDDYRRLRDLADRGERFVVIGGGFIGTEIAAALASNGKRVTLVFPEGNLGERVFPRALAEFVSFYYGEKGVELLSRSSVQGVETSGSGFRVQVRGPSGEEKRIEADGVVAGIGIQAETSLASAAGLECENGIVVDPYLKASAPAVYAAGDVAAFQSPALGRRVRIEHEDNALTMGKAAGRAMAGAGEPYRHLAYFYSDLFDLGYEAVGQLDPSLQVTADWAEPFRKGVVYYAEGGYVRGVLLWNVWDKVPAARRLIQSGRHFRAEELKAALLEN